MITNGVEKSSQDLVIKALKQASQKTGASFDYMLNLAKHESGLRPEVKAKTSSATGLFQFIDSTWLSVVKEFGAQHGLKNYADNIYREASGKFNVRDDALKKNILDLRKEPEIAAVMAGEFIKKNQSILDRDLARNATDKELYLSHFLGMKGAKQFLNTYNNAPYTPATEILPQAAKSNSAIFFDAKGVPKTVKEVNDFFAKKFNNTHIPDKSNPLTYTHKGDSYDNQNGFISLNQNDLLVTQINNAYIATEKQGAQWTYFHDSITYTNLFAENISSDFFRARFMKFLSHNDERLENQKNPQEEKSYSDFGRTV